METRELIFASSIISWFDRGGNSSAAARANMVLPEPGGP